MQLQDTGPALALASLAGSRLVWLYMVVSNMANLARDIIGKQNRFRV